MLALAFAPDGKTLASVSETVKLWDVVARKELADLPIKHPTSVAFAPNSKTLAVGSGVREDKNPGSVALWDLTTRKERATLEGHLGMVWCVGFTPDGKTLASGDSRGTLKLWDVATTKERASIPPPVDASGTGDRVGETAKKAKGKVKNTADTTVDNTQSAATRVKGKADGAKDNATNLLQSTLSVGKLRGRFHDYKGIPVLVTYHPAYLLPHKRPDMKREVWNDMKMLLHKMGRPVPQT